MTLGGDGDDDDTQHTPDRMDIDDATASGRATRGLRQAPPQRQLFQSDMSAARQTRQQTSYTSPAPGGANGIYGANGVTSALANYEPRPPLPLTLRPVTTPANNYEGFKAHQKSIRDLALARMSRTQPVQTKGMMLPGTGFPGPMIYTRTLLALQSGILAEQEYALHHLVKISHERGDKYRFDSFPGLAEALIEKVLEVGPLVYDIDLNVAYSEDAMLADDNALDGINGTRGLIEKLKIQLPMKLTDRMQTEDFATKLTLINEASLVLRNMVMLEENAQFLATLPTVRDLLIILLNLPHSSAIIEMQQYALETAEQLTGFFPSNPEDPLFTSLLAFIDSDDRATILTALHSICRMGIRIDQYVRLEGVPIRTVQKMCEWMLVEDEELRSACLDFLYLYTAAPDNVETLLHNADVAGLVKQLTRLLLHAARVDDTKPAAKMTSKPSVSATPAEDAPIPKISQDLIDQLLVYDEPERSSQWLRSCFEEDTFGEITQIALWQAYQIPFAPYGNQRPLLPAKDFITNVSNTFTNASAQVMNGNPPRFVIKGIKARAVPVDPKGRQYMRCLWHNEDDSECGDFALWPKHMWEHVVSNHLNTRRGEDGKYDFTGAAEEKVTCRWAGCKRFDAPREAADPFTVGMHVKTHLPDSSERAYQRSKHNHSKEAEEGGVQSLATTSWQTRITPVDERSEAAGLPLISVLVLRNLARNLPKTASALKPGAEDLVWQVFAPVRDQIYFVMAYNFTLREYLPSLNKAIDAARKVEPAE
ncbi:hypothetical protein FH972_022966 [Carpinus fangiana]|nr:hypothetical protein FH972_022966 [Carpinus fangiana]